MARSTIPLSPSGLDDDITVLSKGAGVVGSQTLRPEIAKTQLRIDDQSRRVATMTPNSQQHRTATEVLMLLMDSAFLLIEARATIEAAHRFSRDGDPATDPKALNTPRSARERHPVFGPSTYVEP